MVSRTLILTLCNQAKTTKKIVLRMACTECKQTTMKPLKVKRDNAFWPLVRLEGLSNFIEALPVPGEPPAYVVNAQVFVLS